VIYTLGDRRLETAGEDYYIAPDAQVIGSVRLGHATSVWFNCVIRGDSDWIVIGDGTNVQDGTVIHTDRGFPTEIGVNVTIGHRVLLHSCHIGDGCLLGNGAMVLDRARIGRNCLIAAGTLIPPDKEIPDGAVVMGAPGKIVREVSAKDLAMMQYGAEHYQVRLREYRLGLQVDPRS
jgi:carbonic anhydrase/acetyltransferase-like protein (isoleucine patch superfamily)